MKRYRSCLLLLAVAAASAWADSSLSIDGAVAIARENNLGYQRDRIDLEARKRALASQWNLWLPSATAGLGISRANSSPSGNNWSAYGSLAASLTVSPSILEDATRIRLRYEAGLLTYEKAGRALELAVRKSFYALLLAEGSVRLAEQRIARAERSLQETMLRYEAGLVPDLDVFTAQVAREKLSPQLESARTARENSLDSFRLLLGLDAEHPLLLSGSLSESVKAIDPAQVLQAVPQGAGDATLAVRSLEKSLEVARSSLKSAEQSGFLPSISVSASTRPTLSNWTAGGTLSDSGSVSLSLSYPLSNLVPGSAARTAIAEADDSIRKLESQVREARLAAATVGRSTLRSARTALASLEALGRTVDLAQKTYDLTHDAWQQGLKSLSDLENAAATLDEARVEVLGKSHSLLTVILDLEDSLDIPFGTLAR